MLSLLFDSGFWYDLVFIALIGFIIFLCFKYPNSRVYVFSFLGIIFIGITAYCGIQLNYYYTAEGGVWGYITGLIEGNKVTTTVESDTASFSLENIVLTKNADGTYSAVIYSNDKIRLETGKSYGVYVNNEPCTQIDYSTNYVRAEYHYAFLDNNLEILCQDTLQFNFAFYTNGSTFTLTTYGGQEAVNYWNTYFTRNNLIVEVKPIGYVKDDELSVNGQIDDYVTLNYYVDDEVVYSYVYTIGSQVTEFPPTAEKDGLIFAYWQDINGKEVEPFKITTDTNLYAYFYPAGEVELLESSIEIMVIDREYAESLNYTVNLNDYVDNINLADKEISIEFTVKCQNDAMEMYYDDITLSRNNNSTVASNDYGYWFSMTLENSNLKFYNPNYSSSTSDFLFYFEITINSIKLHS